VCFFSTKAFLISAIIIAKIIYLGFLASHINKITLIIWISKVSNKLKSSLVSYIVSYLALGLVLNIKSVLNSSLSSLSIFFVIDDLII